MSISVKLFSEKPGELKDFLSTYYGRTQRIAEDLEQWIYVYRNPLDTVDLISALMDNYESYDISLSLQLPKGEIYIVTKENYNSVIKDIFILFHNAQAAGINRPSVKCTV